MSDPASDLTKSFKRYLHAFNQRDVEGLLAEMHFPHMRLVDDVFQRWETSDGMAEMEEFVTKSLKSEGWHTSEAKSIEAVQVGPEKVHLANRKSRLREDGTEYNTFDTPWIFTKVDGRLLKQSKHSHAGLPRSTPATPTRWLPRCTSHT